MQNYLERPAHVNFDDEAADRAVNFFRDHLRHTKGRWAGQPFILYPFQELHIREIFGRVDDEGNRIIRQVYAERPKKNGKSEEAAGIALKLLLADDEEGAEVYGAAADRDQASIVFDVARQMVLRDPELRQIARIVPSTKRIIIEGDGSFYRALSADVAGKHGFNSHGVIFDEVHAQEHMGLWEVLTFGAGDARSQPLVFAITTAGIPGQSPVAEMLHESADQILRGVIPCPDWFYPVIYAAPEDAPWDAEETWYGCNPAMHEYRLRDGTVLPPFLRVESVRESCEKAKLRPAEQNSFRRLRNNQWVKTDVRAIDMRQWDACGKAAVDIRDLRGLPCYGGLDLSTKQDITAFVLVFVQNAESSRIYHWLPWCWLPEDNLVEKPNMEADKYRAWKKEGKLITTPGNVIDFDAVRARIREIGRETRIRQIRFDPKFATHIAKQLGEDGFEMVEQPQGFYLSEATNEVLDAVVAGGLRHNTHPVLRWCADCLNIEQNSAGLIRPVKPDRRKARQRIDLMVAGIMATAGAMLGEGGPSIYETQGLRTVGLQ